jgi:hypothetical protein
MAMDQLTAYQLRFTCEATTDIVMPPYKGSMIRGALFSALRRDFCLDPRTPVCADCRVRQACPVCCLLATVDEEALRGVEVARPCTVEPPLEGRSVYAPGDRFQFGITLFGDAAGLMPYVIIGVRRMGENGIGSRYRAPGRFTVKQIAAIEPFHGAVQEVYTEGARLVRCPQIPVTHEGILASCRRLTAPSRVTLEVLTPMRLTMNESLVKRLTFPVFLRRLLRRLTDLAWVATHTRPGFDHEMLLRQAEAVRVVDDHTRWLDIPSHSARQGRFIPIGGLVGEISFEGDLTPFAPWLSWGSITHVGKDATKGCGWYRLRWNN